MTATAVRKADIPRIRLLSWLGLEAIAWSVVIAHLVKWSVDALYYLFVQCTWYLPQPPGARPFKIWYLKDSWDGAPVHISNLLGAHWFGGSQAVPGIAIVAVLAWKLAWLTHHGLRIGGGSVLANEVNGYIAAGTWIAVAMGVAGSQVFARFANRKAADAAQWFYAERSAARISSNTGLGRLRGTTVAGTPSHRIRVHWLLDHDTASRPHSVWSVRILSAALFIGLLLSGYGAYLTLAGAAAGAH